jgi:hypothetical protein
MTFIFAPCIAMTAVYSDGTNQVERIVVGFAAAGPQIIETGKGKTIITVTDPLAAPHGMEFMGLIARVIEPAASDLGTGEMDESDIMGELDEAPPGTAAAG